MDGGAEPGRGGSSLAVLLRTWRQRALLTQELLAMRTGLGVRTIRRIETGDIQHPHGKSLRLLAEALELTADERAELAAAAGNGVAGDSAAAATPAMANPANPAQPEPGVLGVARQLPADVAGFTGRAVHLRLMDTMLAGDDAEARAVVLILGGTAGVGKTALAVHWAHRVADRFPDGQLFVNLRGFDHSGTPMSPAEAIRGFLDALHVPPEQVPADLEAQAALYRSLLAGKRVLVVLDNVRDVEQVRPLLPGAPGCGAVVTSRNQLTGLVATSGARPLVLDLMSTAEARELLAGRIGPDRTAAEPAAADEIIALCARLPLALAVAAARAATRHDLPLAALADQLRDSRHRLDVFTTADMVTDVRAVFSWSYHHLGARAARLFRLLGLHPGPDIGVAAAASLAGIAPSKVLPLLTELTRVHLIIERAPGRYAFHDLLRAYATELADEVDTAEHRRAAVHRVLDHYVHTAHAADRVLDPRRDAIVPGALVAGATPEKPPDRGRALAWFVAEHAVLLAAIDHAAATGFNTHAWQLAWTLSTFFERRGHWHDQVATGRAALGCAERLAHLPAQALLHRSLAGAYIMLGRFDAAHTHLRRAIARSSEAGDPAGQAHAHHSLAYVCEQRGRHTESLDHAQRALALFREAGHRDGLAHALNAVGWYHAQLGDHEQALVTCHQALALHQELGNRYGQAGTWDSIGFALHHLGHPLRALTHYRHALDLYRELGERYNEADVLTHLGDAHLAAGDPDAARAAWLGALRILDQLGHTNAGEVRAKLHAI